MKQAGLVSPLHHCIHTFLVHPVIVKDWAKSFISNQGRNKCCSWPLHSSKAFTENKKSEKTVPWVPTLEVLCHCSLHCEVQLDLHLQDVWKLSLIDQLHLLPTPVIWAEFPCQIKDRRTASTMDKLLISPTFCNAEKELSYVSLGLTLMVPSREQDRRNCSQHRRSITTSECPSRVWMHWPCTTSHICHSQTNQF